MAKVSNLCKSEDTLLVWNPEPWKGSLCKWGVQMPKPDKPHFKFASQ